MFLRRSICILSLTIFMAGLPADAESNTAIHLTQCGSLIKPNGTFDFGAAASHLARISNKYQVESNTSHAFTSGTQKRQRLPLTPEKGDVAWTGEISIGSNRQKFVVDFDTGSSDLWIPYAHGCDGCPSRNRTYDPTKSKTSKANPGHFHISYGDQSSVSGSVFTDIVNIAGVKVVNQTFAAVTQMNGSLTRGSFDGIFGMAFKQISNLGANPFLQTAFSQYAVAHNEFSMKLAHTGAELLLGGTNPRLFDGAIEFHRIHETGFWQVPGGEVLVGEKPVIKDIETIIDSGTTLIVGPTEQVEEFYEAIPGSTLVDADRGFYAFPCTAVPVVSFSWGGRAWAIRSSDFNLGRLYAGSPFCVGAVIGNDATPTNAWVVGDSFMKNVYTVFSYEKKAVGFATLKS